MKTTRTSAQFVSRLIIGLALLFGWPGLALRQSAASRTSAAAATVFTTITVDTTDDTIAADGKCSLREAIEAANTDTAVDTCAAGSGADTIEFNLGAGTPTITFTSALPSIEAPVTINGATGGATRVELNGAGLEADGLLIHAGSIIRALVINRFGGSAIHLEGGGGSGIENCYLGTDDTGTIARGNNGYGIYINTSTNNTIGGTAASKRNTISGNLSSGIQIFNTTAIGNTVVGNYIGVDATGTADLGNAVAGVVIVAPNNTVGGATAGARNVISGNDQFGVVIQVSDGVGNNNKVQGNYIGTNVAGTGAIANKVGVAIQSAFNNQIGGTATGEGNLISGNNENGVQIEGVSATGNLIQGNYVGTNAAGTADLGNSGLGILLANGAANNLIGGTSIAARNLVSGNDAQGIGIGNASNNTVQNNYIGSDVTGAFDLGNQFTGIEINNGANNQIGGVGVGNLISGNGLVIFGATATGNQVQGNYIGVNAAGTAALGTNNGLAIFDGASNNIIGGTASGAGNVIAGSPDNNTVSVGGGGATGNQLLGNRIGTNAAGTAVLATATHGVIISDATNTIIGGTTPGARNLIAGSSQNGIWILGGDTTGTQVLGNFIGTDITGTVDLGNGLFGVEIENSANNVIGGTAAGAGNLISGNGSWGVQLEGVYATGNLVQGNFIGTNAAGNSALPNSGGGVLIVDGARNNTIGGIVAGAGNRISFNQEAGVAILPVASTTGNRILGNAIFSNALLGIDLAFGFPLNGVTANDAGDADTGPNNLQNFPVLNPIPTVGTVSGSLDSTAANSAYPIRIEFFANAACDSSGNGEGEVFLGATSIGAPGSFTFNYTPVSGKTFIAATATDANGNTSEFSACRQSGNAPPTISGATITVQKGSVNSTQQIATVNDVNQAAQTLTVKVNGGASATSNGVTVSGLSVDSAGKVTANLTATCDATTTPPRTFTLTVTDNGGLSANATLTVNVTPNAKPALSYDDRTVAVGGTLTVNPATGPSDNGTFVVEFDKVVPKTGITVAVHPVTGVVSITNVTKADTYKIDINITDNCNQKVSATFKLTVTATALAIQTVRAVKNDFDGDRKSDLVDWNPESGAWRIRRSSDGELQIEQWGAAGDLPVPADYDGDGKTDLAVWRAAEGQWLIKRSSDGETLTVVLGERGDTPVPGDYDGDGNADAAIWRAVEGTWLIHRSSDAEEQRLAFGSGDEVAVPGDYDGDGKLDPALWRPSSGQWRIKLSGNGEELSPRWGIGGDVPVPADYDGDGKMDIAVWRGRIGAWLIRRSADGESQNIWCGWRAFGDAPVPGDYDGDGKTDAAVWRAVEGAWYIRDSAGNLPLQRVRPEGKLH